jgi:hypothetical protein
MITPSQVGWGSYKQYSGAFVRGSAPFTLSQNPTEDDRTMAVITAAEGGHFDSINAYDRCILTAGIIQFCEAGQFSVSDLLGAVADKNRSLLDLLKPALAQAKARFDRNEKLRYRFFFDDARGEVDTTQEQHQLFQLHSDGTSWDDESKQYVKVWAASVANVLAQPEAAGPQISFTAKRLMNFVSQSARACLWDGTPNTGWVAATRAAYTSFAVNSPATASQQLQTALGSATAPKWSPGWCVPVLKQLTFGSGISIYPRRYDVMRPVMEKLYSIDLPDFANDLQGWHETHGIDPAKPVPTFMDTKEIQGELILEGYDLGPAKADGNYGGKTKEAVRTFQGLHGLPSTGLVDGLTRQALAKEWTKRS